MEGIYTGNPKNLILCFSWQIRAKINKFCVHLLSNWSYQRVKVDQGTFYSAYSIEPMLTGPSVVIHNPEVMDHPVPVTFSDALF